MKAFLLSASCIIATAKNDFEMEAILNGLSFVSGAFVSVFLLPSEWV